MRTAQRFAIAVMLCGVLVLALSTGSLLSGTADRSVTVETASDANAVLGLTYPEAVTPSTPDPTVQLASGDARSGGCFWFWCFDYTYPDVDLVTLSDNADNSTLIVDELEYQSSNAGMTDSLSNRSNTDGLRTVSGSFVCEAQPSGQQAEQTEVSISVVASDQNGSVVVDLTRTVVVECLSG